jgi:hypothetical protein
VAAAAITAAVRGAADELDVDDDDLETVEEPHASFAAASSGNLDQQELKKRRQQRRATQTHGDAPSIQPAAELIPQSKPDVVIAAASPAAATAQPPPSLLNPWSSSLFTRNFQDESRNAELFVQLSRERTAQQQAEAAEAEKSAAKQRRKNNNMGKPKGSIVLASTSDERDGEELQQPRPQRPKQRKQQEEQQQQQQQQQSSQLAQSTVVDTHEFTQSPSPRHTPPAVGATAASDDGGDSDADFPRQPQRHAVPASSVAGSTRGTAAVVSSAHVADLDDDEDEDEFGEREGDEVGL